ncbi:hypothetical protein [Fulvivirga sedimenti]|uniref:Uncharacterized protein n=1 Tax=Fulvivirga sedimenti TaxID=2879465 RepID=A0A9X1L1V3_9BACT|nr:hypothetical protein [Fulvivirga sedimenti]MCA6079084.1 hypothetical protein [Fulvivirga sedimenti]
MNLEIKTKHPQFNVYLNFFGLFIIPFVFVGLLIAIFSDDLPISYYYIFFMLPLVLAVALTFSSRPFTLRIDSVVAMDKLEDYVMEYLVSENLMTVDEDVAGIRMQSTRKIYQMLNDWFGTEIVKIIRTPLYMEVTGHRRYVEGLEAKLRYGRKN